MGSAKGQSPLASIKTYHQIPHLSTRREDISFCDVESSKRAECSGRMHGDHAQYGKNSGMMPVRDHHCCFPPSSGRMVIESSLEGEEMKNLNESVGIRIENLSKVFIDKDKKGRTVAVDNVSLEVAPGELVTLLGPSGCGKTTILRMLAGFTMPTAGTIWFGDEDVTSIPPNKRNVGMMFQSYALFPHLSVFDNIAYGLKVKKLSHAEIIDKVDNVMDMMRISEYAKRIPEQLSGGQQQRVALARAIVNEPRILLFDEPLSNLDAKMREYMREELRKIQQRLGITSVYVTHDQIEAMAISDHVMIMKDGVIEQVGTPSDIYVHPVNTFVANFMGKANFAKGKVLSAGNDTVEIDLFGLPVSVAANHDVDSPAGAAVAVMIRPEFVKLDRNGRWKALIRRATFFGEKMEYEIQISDRLLTISDSEFITNGIYREDDTISISICQKGLRILPYDPKEL